MAKVSPVSIKYMIHANFLAEGALEKPDVIGALFGQTEGLLGADLEMRELQKEGKIGRIEVDLERKDKRTVGKIKIPTALDQSETTLIGAAIETIDRIGPCDSSIEVEKIEDVRGSKRDYIIERAKKLMGEIHGATDSREISREIKDSTKMSDLNEYGDEKLPCGDLSSDSETIVVEGRADVLSLLRAGVKNVIAMNGTKLPETIKQLAKEKDIVLFVDGDRGGKLIAQNVVDNLRVKAIVVAPDGKEVEELMPKEVLMTLRRRVSPEEFFRRDNYQQRQENGYGNNRYNNYQREQPQVQAPSKQESANISFDKDKLKQIAKENSGSEKAILLNESLEEIKSVSVKSIMGALRKAENVFALAIDGTVTSSILESAEEAGVKVVAAKNFATTETSLKLVSF